MRNVFIFTFLAIISLNSISAQNTDTVFMERKHNIHFSVGAPAMYCGLTYEYMFRHLNKITILTRTGVGLNIFKPSIGKEFDIHTGITVLYGNKPSKLELGLGLIHYFMENYDFEMEKNKLKYKLILYGLIGYRFEFKNNPTTIKIGITPVLVFNKDNKVFFPLAELGFGFRL
jgi:hypothetical protein